MCSASSLPVDILFSSALEILVSAGGASVLAYGRSLHSRKPRASCAGGSSARAKTCQPENFSPLAIVCYRRETRRSSITAKEMK